MVEEKIKILIDVLSKHKKLSANKFKDQVCPEKMAQQTFFNVVKKAAEEKIIVKEEVEKGKLKMSYYTLPSYSEQQKKLIVKNETTLSFLILIADALLNKEFKYQKKSDKEIKNEIEYIAEATVELFYHAMLIKGFLETIPHIFGYTKKENADKLLAVLMETIEKIKQTHLKNDEFIEQISDVAGIHYQELQDFFTQTAPDLYGIMVVEYPYDSSEGTGMTDERRMHLAKHGTLLEQAFFGDWVGIHKQWEQNERNAQAFLDGINIGKKVRELPKK